MGTSLHAAPSPWRTAFRASHTTPPRVPALPLLGSHPSSLAPGTSPHATAQDDLKRPVQGCGGPGTGDPSPGAGLVPQPPGPERLRSGEEGGGGSAPTPRAATRQRRAAGTSPERQRSAGSVWEQGGATAREGRGALSSAVSTPAWASPGGAACGRCPVYLGPASAPRWPPEPGSCSRCSPTPALPPHPSCPRTGPQAPPLSSTASESPTAGPLLGSTSAQGPFPLSSLSLPRTPEPCEYQGPSHARGLTLEMAQARDEGPSGMGQWQRPQER